MITYELESSSYFVLLGSSQEMEFLVQRHHVLLDLLHSLFAVRVHVTLALPLPVVVVQAHRGIEVGDLVSILARSWHFDRSCPVEVEVAQSKRQVLNVQL